MIVENDKVKAARVILPVTDQQDLPPEYGLRHRAGLGISEVTDSLVVIVSEETGQISLSENGILLIPIVIWWALRENTGTDEDFFVVWKLKCKVRE